ncbi:hypothetical protein RI056_13400 [Komagataeibacter nataicola]|nr:hypothetical protein RI056_13400 [Komagataeibacter nataicola]
MSADAAPQPLRLRAPRLHHLGRAACLATVMAGLAAPAAMAQTPAGADWPTPRQAATGNADDDPIAAKLLVYLRLLSGAGGTAEEYATFLNENPAWPQRGLLLARYQQALAGEADDAVAGALCPRLPLTDVTPCCAAPMPPPPPAGWRPGRVIHGSTALTAPLMHRPCRRDSGRSLRPRTTGSALTGRNARARWMPRPGRWRCLRPCSSPWPARAWPSAATTRRRKKPWAPCRPSSRPTARWCSTACAGCTTRNGWMRRWTCGAPVAWTPRSSSPRHCHRILARA